jgi:hypothetical protein
MSNNIQRDIFSRFEKKIAARTASTRSGRFDLRLSDYEVLSGKREARVLVAYAQELGVPKLQQLDEWVTSSFGGRLVLELETPRIYADARAVVALVRTNEVLRPEVHKSRMIVASPNRYMDHDKSIWEVRKNDTGDRFLVRVADDDMDEILRVRQENERTASLHHRLRLADVREASGNPEVEVGDRISYMFRGILQKGEVTHVSDDQVHVKVAANDTRKVSKENVVDIFEKSPEAKKDQTSFLVKFFTEAYGDPDFAKQLVSLNNTGLK